MVKYLQVMEKRKRNPPKKDIYTHIEHMLHWLAAHRVLKAALESATKFRLKPLLSQFTGFAPATELLETQIEKVFAQVHTKETAQMSGELSHLLRV